MALAKPTVTANETEVETVAAEQVAQEVSSAGVDAIAEEAEQVAVEQTQEEVKAPAVQANTAVAPRPAAAAPMLGGSNFTKVAAENGFKAWSWMRSLSR